MSSVPEIENGQPSLADIEEDGHESQSEPDSDHDSEPADMTSDISSYSSYAEYIRTLAPRFPVGDRRGYFDWLNLFFGSPNPTPPADNTHTFVLHTEHGKLHRYKAHEIHSLTKILRPRATLGKVQTRIIIVSYRHTWTLNRSIVDMLALKFRLHPVHLYKMLYNEDSRDEKNRPTHPETREIFWPSDPNIITLPWERHMVFTTATRMSNVSAIEIHETESDKSPKQTLLVFARSLLFFRIDELELDRFYPIQSGIPKFEISCYLDILNSLTESAIRAADQSPTDFLLPFAQVFALDIRRRLHTTALLAQAGYIMGQHIAQHNGGFQDMTREGLKYRWKLLQQQWWAFVCCHNSLKVFAPSPARDQVEADYAYLENVFLDTRQELRDEIHRQNTLLTLEVSEQSIKESQSVRRLTQLAFVFIPLTFVTSCFGMNLDILSSGSAQLSTFFISALSLTAGILILSSNYTRTSLSYLVNLAENNTRTIRTLIKLTNYLPTHVFWLIRLETRYPGTHLVQATLWTTNAHSQLFGRGTETREFEERPELGPLWNKKARELFDFFNHPTWDENTVWRRLYERLKRWARRIFGAGNTANSDSESTTEQVEMGTGLHPVVPVVIDREWSG